MALAEFNDFLRNKSKVSHVSEADLLRPLGLITALLPFNNRGSDPSGVKYIDSECPVVATLHGPIEDLLNHIVNNIVKEVVPWETEEEALSMVSIDVHRFPKELLTSIVGTTLFSTNWIFK